MSRVTDKNLVSGGGWISDDSSFYGSETEQEQYESRCDSFELGEVLSAHSKDLNTITASARIRQQKKKAIPANEDAQTADVVPLSSLNLANKASGFFAFDRKSMEEERLARLGKRKRDAEDELVEQLELFNIFEGDPYAWQLGESVDDFVKRVPPATTSALTCSWIWVSNPHRNSRNKSAGSRIAEFTERGSELMSRSLQARQDIQAKGRFGSKSTLTCALNQEGKALQQGLSNLAKETNVIAGKWMLFPRTEDVTRVWKVIVEAVINGRLGPTAKVAPDDGKPERLICIYTKDFQDEADVLRVLKELDALKQLPEGRGIYYKSDAWTYLNLYRETAEQYGLQASLYTSHKMLNAARLASTSPKKRTKLKDFLRH